jgi:outer membrane lipoprotein-sorting protein
MIRKTLAGLVVAVLATSGLAAQTADEIVEKSIEARGGREKLDKLQTLRMTGNMVMGEGMEAPFQLELSRPNKMRMELTFQGMTIVQAYDGAKGWMINPMMGKTEPEALPDEMTKSMAEQADFDGLLYDYKGKGHQVEYVGKEDMEGTPAHHLKVTKKSGDVTHVYLDAEHFLELKVKQKTQARGQEVEGETVLGDYKEVEGIVFPHSMESQSPGMPGKMVMNISKIELNPDLSASRFEMPAAAPAKDEAVPKQ